MEDVPGDPPSTIRVGVDVTSVDEVADSIRRFGDRYVKRVFTSREIESCSTEPASRAASLAARFAAKEATLKVLRPVEARPDWRSIEVRRHVDGWCDMVLTGGAARLAELHAIRSLAVSLSHQDNVATAVVVALSGGGLDGPSAEVAEQGIRDRRASGG